MKEITFSWLRQIMKSQDTALWVYIFYEYFSRLKKKQQHLTDFYYEDWLTRISINDLFEMYIMNDYIYQLQ